MNKTTGWALPLIEPLGSFLPRLLKVGAEFHLRNITSVIISFFLFFFEFEHFLTLVWVNTNFVVVLSSRVRLYVTPWAEAPQAPLSSVISWSLLRFMSVESVMLSNRRF